jgi:hypothetical protein
MTNNKMQLILSICYLCHFLNLIKVDIVLKLILSSTNKKKIYVQIINDTQFTPSNDVSGEYQVRFPGGTTLGQCACLYARAGLIAHLWWVGTGVKAKK